MVTIAEKYIYDLGDVAAGITIEERVPVQREDEKAAAFRERGKDDVTGDHLYYKY